MQNDEQDHQPIQLDSPPAFISLPQHSKRRRINSPDPISKAEIIDSALARVLWLASAPQKASALKRPRHSDQTAESSSDPNPIKKIRQHSPQPDSGTKRSQDVLRSSLQSDHDEPNAKRPKKENVMPPLPVRPNYLQAAPSSSKHKLGPPHPSPNFILASENRTQYAIKVEMADKNREEGNARYQRKEYRHAILHYTQAIDLYPTEPFPGQPHHPGYSASLANRASAYMALGQYHTASIDLQASIKAIHLPPLIPQDTRAMLIKRVFRLVRCYLAVLDAPNASQTLNTLSSDYLDVQKILPGDSNYNDFLILSSRIKFLLELKDKMDLARSVQNWQSALRLIATFEREILTWGLKFNLSHLPGSWTLCKAEMLARTGKPVEAERILALVIPSASLKCEYVFNEALTALARADLSKAHRKLTEVLMHYPNYAPASRMKNWLSSLISSMDTIKAFAARASHISAIAQCDRFLLDFKDLILTTLQIKVETVRCEQLAAQCLKDPSSGLQHCSRLVSSNASLLKRMNFTGPSFMSKTDLYEPYREYLVRVLLAQARATFHYPHLYDWQTTYMTVYDLRRSWCNLPLPSVTCILNEIRRRISEKTSNNSHHHSSYFNNAYAHYSYFNNSQHHSSSRNRHYRPTGNANQPYPSSSDPKGYYQTLGLQKGATMVEIKKAFRALSLKHHPDKGGQTEIFQTINQAHLVLSNPESRSAYDMTGR